MLNYQDKINFFIRFAQLLQAHFAAMAYRKNEIFVLHLKRKPKL